MRTPILFLTFKRFDTTKIVFEEIRKSKTPRLYIASDGPRIQRPEEYDQIQKVRQYILQHIDWDCEVKTLFRDENLGGPVSNSTAIDWFFENEEEGIILEDDCLPHPTFFSYAEELLKKYRYDQRIMAISGSHYHQNRTHNFSYFFSRYFLPWGWASWRRSWTYFDRNMDNWPFLRDTNWLLSVGDGSYYFNRYWFRIFDKLYNKDINAWDYRWIFSCWSQNGLTIRPTKNLIKNIGFGKDATHTQNSNNRLSKFPLEKLAFPLIHPPFIAKDYVEDMWTDKYRFNINWFSDFKNSVKSVLYTKKN